MRKMQEHTENEAKSVAVGNSRLVHTQSVASTGVRSRDHDVGNNTKQITQERLHMKSTIISKAQGRRFTHQLSTPAQLPRHHARKRKRDVGDSEQVDPSRLKRQITVSHLKTRNIPFQLTPYLSVSQI